jgi:hypothetical protein
MKQAMIVALCLCPLPGAPALADQANANTCAAFLGTEARLVFDAVQADPQPTQPLRKVLATKVGGLVATGKLSLLSARSAATAASDCLRIARDCTAEYC